MEDNNILDYNQHQLMKIASTLITGPNLVFLAPTKKGLRSTILKCNIILARNHMALLHNLPMLCTSIIAYHSAGQQCSSISSHSAQHGFSSQLLINLWSSAHQPCQVCTVGHASLFIILSTSKLFINTCSSAHQPCQVCTVGYVSLINLCSSSVDQHYSCLL